MVELLRVIKYEGPDNVLVWKHPAEDFNTHSKLIVHESQVAILYKNGQALDEFQPGKYTLKNENIPLLRIITNIPTKGVSPFHCEVYFINKATSLNVDWGTSSRFPIIEPLFQIPINVGASGGMDLVIDDARKFLVNVVGTQDISTTEQLNEYFKAKVTTKVKNYLAQIMSEVSYYNITQHLEEISEALHNKLKEDFAEYGVNLITFFVSNIIVPKEETQKIQEVLNKKMEYGTLGFNWADEQMADIAKRYASNPGSQNGVDGMVAGMPLAMAFGQMLTDNVADKFTSNMFGNGKNFGNNSNSNNTPTNTTPNTNNNKFCNKCGHQLSPEDLFCSNCGTKVNKELKCKNCGKILFPEAKFCPQCGTPVQ